MSNFMVCLHTSLLWDWLGFTFFCSKLKRCFTFYKYIEGSNMSEGIEHNNTDRKSSGLNCVLSMFRLEIRKSHVNQWDEWNSRRAFQTQLGHKPTVFSGWRSWEWWDYWVEAHLQFSVTACNTGSWVSSLWVFPSFEGNRLELSVSCIYCCTVILYLIIPLP